MPTVKGHEKGATICMGPAFDKMPSPPGPSSSTFGSSSSSSPLSSNRLVTSDPRSLALPQDPRRNSQTGTVITRIEEILIAIVDALSENRVLTIPFRSRRTGTLQLVRFPSHRDAEVKRFTALLQILHLSHQALIAGTVITKRAIYYQNPELFGSQQYVNELVDDVAFTFGVGRAALNIVAASKGLISGAISVTVNSGSTFYCNSDDCQGVLLPDVQAVTGIDLGPVKWLLVIEKEATFRGLVASKYHETATAGPGVLITAKGYPDLSTRKFLHRLQTSYPTLPMFGLVDFDPHGVKIMLTYKNGSRSLQHEENVTLNQLEWIGLRSNDVLGYRRGMLPSADTNQSNSFSRTSGLQFASSPSGVQDLRPAEVTLPLRVVDRSLAIQILSAAADKDCPDVEGIDLIRELQVMLLLNSKAEIQAVDEAGDLTAWLDTTLTKRTGGI